MAAPAGTSSEGSSNSKRSQSVRSSTNSTGAATAPAARLVSSEITKTKVLSLLSAFLAFVCGCVACATNYWACYSSDHHPFKPPGHMRTQYIDVRGHWGVWQLCGTLAPDGRQHHYGKILCEAMNRIQVEGRPLWYFLPIWLQVLRCVMMLSLGSIFFSFFPTAYLLLVTKPAHVTHVLRVNLSLYVCALICMGTSILLFTQNYADLSLNIANGSWNGKGVPASSSETNGQDYVNHQNGGNKKHNDNNGAADSLGAQIRAPHVWMSWSLWAACTCAVLLLLGILCLVYEWRQANRILFRRMSPVGGRRSGRRRGRREHRHPRGGSTRACSDNPDYDGGHENADETTYYTEKCYV